MNPYGYLSFWKIDIHYVTLFCMIILYIVYYRRIGHIKNQFMKIGLPLLYCFGAAMHYEIFWNFGWMLSWPIIILEVIGFSMCEYIILKAITDLGRKYEINLPSINLYNWIIVSCYFLVSIIFLSQTDFYQIYTQLHLNLTNENPHNLTWAIGKLGTLGWIWVAPK